MRDIEFRGKRSDGEWVYGYYFAKPILDKHFIECGENQWLVCGNTVGQYTGLKDKSGVKIYEGDVVHYDATPYNAYGLDVVGEIVFHKFSWKMMYQKYDMTNFYPIGSEDFFGAKSEVIGNIHDNPELL